jgi:hypothetical protein
MLYARALPAFVLAWAYCSPAAAQDTASSESQENAASTVEPEKPALNNDDGSPNRRCKKKGSAIRTVGLQASFASHRQIDTSTVSVFAENRICKRSDFQWSALAAFDRVDTEGRITTAGRIGGGVYKFWQIGTGKKEPAWSQNLGVGMNALIGYEDFNIVEVAPGGNLVTRRGKRPSGILDAYAVLTSNNMSQAGGLPPPDTSLTAEAHLYFVNKRAPSADLPDFLNEEYFVATSTVSIDHFVDHHPFGSRVQLLLQYQRILTDRSLVRDITTARVQWRPQRNPAYDNPDAMAVAIGYRFGDRYSGLILEMSKSF